MPVKGNAIYFYSKSESWFELSNWYESAFELEGVWWPTVIHYFTAQKTLDLKKRDIIRGTKDMRVLRRIIEVIELRQDWSEIQDAVMYKALKAKFTQNSTLKRLLLTTGDRLLYERNPTELYWGYKGKNMMGVLLMKLRDELGELY